MVGMLEWLGRQLKEQYSGEPYKGSRLLIGDISGPKGGCLYGPSGRKGHASHTSGQDADVGFLNFKAGVDSPAQFSREFNLTQNWSFIKKILKNPFACVKVIFLDRHNIHSLSKFAQKDEDWQKYSRFIRHMPGHKNHLHIRIGDGPGQPGCSPDAKPELETEDDGDLYDDLESVQENVLRPGYEIFTAVKTFS